MVETVDTSPFRHFFFTTHLTGFAAGGVFPFIVSPLIGPPALGWPFILSSVALGVTIGSILFWLARAVFKSHLRHQLATLSALTGEAAPIEETVKGLHAAFANRVNQLKSSADRANAGVDSFVPHYRSLAELGRNLSERAGEGLIAARSTRTDVENLSLKQQQVMAQVETLSSRAQDEAAISRELHASLEEMSEAMEHSNAKFLETTASVDEMASSVLEVAAQADEIARAVEGTARNLDDIGDSLGRIRAGAASSAQAAATVRQDAESGLVVVRTSMEEMERIEGESLRAMAAMQRLSRQTGEVAKIIGVIRELVSDTELLAFNAAIIAAKAGEEGRGFAVVAEEIRDLADRTTNSAQDIHRIVQAIGGDTREVTEAVEATGKRIARGKQLSVSTGEALRKIVDSSSQAAAASEEIAEQTGKQGTRAKSLLEDAGHNLRSVKAIARAMQEQQTAIVRIQDGVIQMKGAADQIARGMDEQVRANRELGKSLTERQTQIEAINEATRFQMATVQRVFSHFAASERRLQGNAEKSAVITGKIAELEVLAGRLRERTAFERS